MESAHNASYQQRTYSSNQDAFEPCVLPMVLKEKIENHRMTYMMYYLSILRSILDPSEGAMRYYIPIFITKIKEKKTYYRIVVV